MKTFGIGDLKVSVMVQAGPKHEDFIFYPLVNKEVEKQPVRMGLYMVDCVVSSIFVATLNCMLLFFFWLLFEICITWDNNEECQQGV